ncbi:actin protein 10 [Echinococcus multilocularis]|uniref:Actin protein 10 n=1 Tax=Echinococcus multilocularis TaxID=6211 RepID=A0A087VZQ1_ECHMU|nr:actin protein 10 [Echinococcus multilocularis]
MTIYDSLIGEKTPIIFDLGAAYLKCGFAGEASPRFILPSPFIKMDFSNTNLFESLKGLFYRLCYRYLLVNPKERRVVIVESIMTPTHFRQTIADVLFRHFEVPSILFAPAHLVALFTLGISTGLVLDCGYSEALVLPVCEGFTLLSTWHSAHLGSRHIHKRLESQIREHAFVEDDGAERQKLSEVLDIGGDTHAMLEDILMRACFVSPADRAALWQKWIEEGEKSEEGCPSVQPPPYATESFTCPLAGCGEGTRLVHIPSRLRESATEILFTPDNADGVTITTLFLDCLLMCPIDCRMSLVQNVVCIGGTTMLPGFVERLNEELQKGLDLPQYALLAALKKHLKFHKPPAKANYTAWLGGAIFGALECLPGRSLLRGAYLKDPKLPDWNDIPDITVPSAHPDLEPKYSR